MIDNNTSPRAAALASVVAVLKHGRFSNLEIDSALKRESFPNPSDRALYTRLVYGVIERLYTLDAIINSYSARPVTEMDLPVAAALRLGVYQLVYMDKIPDFAAVSETVELVSRKSRGFVNGVLRSFLRAEKKFSLPTGDDPESMSVRFSVSPEICEILVQSYGTAKACAILEAYFSPVGVCLRVNTLKSSTEAALSRIAEAGEDVRLSEFCPGLLRVSGVSSVIREGIEAGLWFVQDEASRMCTAVLGAEPGCRTADVCAAPGGKSFSAAIDMENKGELFSFDIHKNKLSLIESGCERLGIGIVSVAARDGRDPDPALAESCHRVLCDAPCSGIGVIGKKPDLRYKEAGAFGRLPEIQQSVLRGASAYVKSGGVLVYSTCTLNTRENEDVVTRFLRENGGFEPIDFSFEGRSEKNLSSKGGMLTLFPDEIGTDGFFIAKMRKI